MSIEPCLPGCPGSDVLHDEPVVGPGSWRGSPASSSSAAPVAGAGQLNAEALAHQGLAVEVVDGVVGIAGNEKKKN